MKARLFFALILTLGLVLGAGTALAHTASRSFSTWHEDGRTLSAIYSLDRLQATLLVPLTRDETALPELLAGHLAASVHVSQGGKPCQAALPRALPSPPQSLRMGLRFVCPAPVLTAGWSLRDDAFFDLASTHIHIARIDNDPELREFVFTSTRREHVMRPPAGSAAAQAPAPGFWASLVIYIRLGISHILHGFDHLAFVTALILLARNYKDVALLVTGFTLGHSITLSLSALGIIQPDSAAIEALIGFSIAFVAMEVLLPPTGRDWRRATMASAALFAVLSLAAALGLGALAPQIWIGLAIFVFSYGALVRSVRAGLRASLALTVGFGLVHGAGFATVLREAGLPAGRRVAALAGFNIGVEIGQLVVVAAWLVVFALASRLGTQAQARLARTLLGAFILMLGIYWFASRAMA